MLAAEKKSPEQLAIDKPSHKFLKFLQKHYGLSQFVPQGNNYVVFDRYFTSASQSASRRTDEDASLNRYNNTSQEKSRTRLQDSTANSKVQEMKSPSRGLNETPGGNQNQRYNLTKDFEHLSIKSYNISESRSIPERRRGKHCNQESEKGEEGAPAEAEQVERPVKKPEMTTSNMSYGFFHKSHNVKGKNF